MWSGDAAGWCDAECRHTSHVQHCQAAAAKPWSLHSTPTPAHTSHPHSEQTQDKDQKSLKLSVIFPFAYCILVSDAYKSLHVED